APSILITDPGVMFVLGPQSLYSHLTLLAPSSHGLSSINPKAICFCSPLIVCSLRLCETTSTSISMSLSVPDSSDNELTFFVWRVV
ncbi:MAG: hypothetical protein L7T81_07660, partial [Candidatus Poseidoniaceae archaeon]|nr:hypothetical protein [Candidatus Poseidoniaceae archaeon]